MGVFLHLEILRGIYLVDTSLKITSGPYGKRNDIEGENLESADDPST